MKEVERTFLARHLPDLGNCKSKEIIDIYIPKSDVHPKMRIRKNGDKFIITKKVPLKDNDTSVFEEQNIFLTEEEFAALAALDGKRVRKIRYEYFHKGKKAEIDVFQGSLSGLVLVDFEFDSEEEKNAFEMPDFCLAEVTQEEFIAGGMLCGKSFEDIKDKLEKFGYRGVVK
ncbi:MAG: hypothetical protein J4469_04985 [Candidatus Aenigmarchaeota archaeon]|nr:hypothetical protein [Candidatus Aenigmarchaeota archaeon]